MNSIPGFGFVEEGPLVLHPESLGGVDLTVVGGHDAVEPPEGEPVLRAEELLGIRLGRAFDAEPALADARDEGDDGVADEQEEEGDGFESDEEAEGDAGPGDGHIAQVGQHVILGVSAIGQENVEIMGRSEYQPGTSPRGSAVGSTSRG